MVYIMKIFIDLKYFELKQNTFVVSIIFIGNILQAVDKL